MNVTFPAVTTSISSQINKRPNTQPTPPAFQSADRLTLSKPTPKFAGKAEDEKLLTAASSGSTAKIRTLLRQGANIEARDSSDWTSLHWAAAKGHLDAIRTLKQLGANYEARDNNGQTPLHAAVGNRRLETICTLKQIGANIEARDNEGSTPLHWAAGVGHPETIYTLENLGANLEATNDEGQTPLDLAKAHRQKEAQKLLETLLEKQKKQPAQPAESRSTLNPKQQELSKPTLNPIQSEQSGLSPKAPLEKQSRPTLNPRQQAQWNRILHSAIETDSIETIEGIVQSGADINAPGLDGQTPLQRAWEQKNLKMVLLLAQLGATQESLEHVAEHTPHRSLQLLHRETGPASASSQTRYSVIPEEDALPTRGPGSYVPSVSTRSTTSTDSQETIRRFSLR